MRKLLAVILTAGILCAYLPAEQFMFMPLWGKEAANAAQWKVSAIPLSIDRVELNYNVRDTGIEYMRLGYGVYDLELRMPRLKKDFAPQKIKFLVQLYDAQGNSLLEEEHEENLFVIEKPDFSFADTAEIKLPGMVLDSEPAQVKVWIKSYTDKNGQEKVFIKDRPQRDKSKRDKTEIKIILPR
jgi:hypothetical protein